MNAVSRLSRSSGKESVTGTISQLDQMLAAVRSGDSGTVFAMGQAAARASVENIDMFKVALEHADSVGDRAEAARFATLLYHASGFDLGHGQNLVDRLIKGKAFTAAQRILLDLTRANPDAPKLTMFAFRAALADPAVSDEKLANELTKFLSTALPPKPAEVEARAVQLIAAQRYDMAATFLSDAKTKLGPCFELDQQLAILAYRQGDWDKADALWLEAAEIYPTLARASRIYRARIALSSDNRDKADGLYAEILAAERGNVEAGRHVARQQIRAGEFDAAEMTIRLLREQGKDEPGAYWLEAMMFSAKGDEHASVALIKRALGTFPEDAGLAIRLTDLRSDVGDWPMAHDLLLAARDRSPTDFAIASRLVRSAGMLDLPPAETMIFTRRALSIRPTEVGMIRTKANLHGRLGERDDALATALNGVACHPKEVSLWRILIAQSLSLSRFDDVARYLAGGLEAFSGTNIEDKLASIELLRVGEAHDRAAELSEECLNEWPDNKELLSSAATLNIALGQWRAALPQLDRLLTLSNRVGPEAGLRAQVAAAIAAVDQTNPVESETAVFPDALINTIVKAAPQMEWGNANPIIVHVSASLGAGGAERQLALTLQRQAERHSAGGMRPVFIADDLDPGRGRDFFLADVLSADVETLELKSTRASGSARTLMALDRKHRHAISLLSALSTDMAALAVPLYVEFALLKPRVVHLWQDTTAIAGAVAAVMAGIPTIVIGTRSTHPVERQRTRPWLAAGYQALRTRKGVIFLNNSRNGGRDYENWLGWQAGSFVPVYNGYDFAKMQSNASPKAIASVKKQLGLPQNALVMGGVMRTSFEKRPELWTRVAITLAERDPRFHGVLVGHGPMQDELQAMIDGAGLTDRIHLAGRQSPVEPWMRAMDTLFLSSLTEGLPNVLIEAQSLGVPVVSMRVGGAPETMVEGETGMLFDNADPALIADQILPFLLDREKRQAYGAAAAQWAGKTFSVSTMLDTLDQLYAQPWGTQ